MRCCLRAGTRAMSRSLPGTRIYSRPSGLPLYSNPAVGWKTAPTGDREALGQSAASRRERVWLQGPFRLSVCRVPPRRCNAAQTTPTRDQCLCVQVFIDVGASPCCSPPRLATNTSESGSGLRLRGAVMIHPQVHLRIPCYDFYFLYSGQFAHLLGTPRASPKAGLRDQSEELINWSDR